jgi:hypothetical protein
MNEVVHPTNVVGVEVDELDGALIGWEDFVPEFT